MKRTVAALCLTLLAFPALSVAPFEGAIVIRDGAPVYAGSRDDKIEWRLERGDAVAISVFRANYWYDEIDGRVQVFFFLNADQRGAFAGGWMDPKGLSRFTYHGPCRLYNWGAARAGFDRPTQWDACFLKARDKQLDALRALRAQVDAPDKASGR